MLLKYFSNFMDEYSKIRIKNKKLSLMGKRIVVVLIHGVKTHYIADVTHLRMNDNITKSIRILNGLAKKLKRRDWCWCINLASPETSPYSTKTFRCINSAAESVGVKLNCSSSKELADSLDKAIVPGQPYFNKLLEYDH
ncbi:hypothetical protein BCR36DRAFT_375896 [Piromyces finnis]|uniref:Uncharacterized protein n=1 Tax=Piromyces finnis TaxID=1754191 RepID=A0A1Y1U9B2_9FUNG|nr:hypothetical protein BCR36DRAFT_375896 [Piromyces finnis]|eukprot:ORX34618.1 hypothetical protein BCR36DRAFT_375896 [Piromyces finnis]